MNLITYRAYNIPFRGIEKDNPIKKDGKNQMDFLTQRALEIFSQRVQNEVPENGKFSNLSVSWGIPDTQNKATVLVEADEINPKDLRRVLVASRRDGSDRLVTSYIFKGTKKEVLEFIQKEDTKEKVKETAFELSKKVDDMISDLY